MTTLPERSRRRTTAGVLLAAALMTSCIEVRDASDDKKAAADSAAAASAASSAADSAKSPPQRSTGSATFGPDSVTRVRGGPMQTPEALAALQSDTSHSVTDLDTSAVLSGADSSTAGAKGSLLIPVRGIEASALFDTYDEQRGGGTRSHEALDIPASRGTPVLSATAGRVLKLFDSKAGGKMVYAADSTERFILMYAHLDGYASGLAEGQPLTRGQVIGTVGTTGNAPPNLPHLHFAIARSSDVKQWWKGSPVNPYPMLVP
jgi:murein DD-endopeptidase MepM/ murein hydrolase activator NlpD